MSVYSEITAEYKAKRRRNDRKLRERREALNKSLPRLPELEKELSLLGIELSKTVIEASPGLEAKLGSIKAGMEKLKKERAALLKENGHPDDYLQPLYDCPKCQDTGYCDGKKCSCHINRLIEKHGEISGLSQMSREDSFAGFDLKYYSADADKAKGISPRVNMKVIKSACMKYCGSFGPRAQSLYICGDTGIGKTKLCNCIANDLLAKGYVILYFTASQLFKLIEDNRFSKNEENTELISLVFSGDLLIVDDLGTEYSNIVTDAEFFNIINIRLINQKPVIISTNLDPQALSEHYSERVASRILGNYTLLNVFGDDVRLKKKYE